MNAPANEFLIARGENDLLYDVAGRKYIDLFSAHGAAWLGHANPVVAEAIARQLREVWNTGAISTPIREQAREAVESLFPDSHRLAGFYSTGMEAAEFALRMARVLTCRSKVIGFEHSMHGKSLATAALSWENDWNLETTDLRRIPFVDQRDEVDVIDTVHQALRKRDVATVFVEPMLGSYGGHAASPEFYAALRNLSQEYGALLVFDEILTGFGRTGTNFVFESVNVSPDVVLIGKALGAGFPVSGVVVNRRTEVESRMLPGSTFAGNALAAAAVAAALGEMKRLDIVERVAAIAEVIERELSPLRDIGVGLRGRGALWVLELPEDVEPSRLLADVYNEGVAIGSNAHFVRLLPAVTIEIAHLTQACQTLAAVIRRHVTKSRGVQSRAIDAHE